MEARNVTLEDGDHYRLATVMGPEFDSTLELHVQEYTSSNPTGRASVA